MKTLFTTLIFTLAASIAASAQQAYTYTYTTGYADTYFGPEASTKGHPFSAEAVTENIQTLADGNRIIRRSTTRLYRDGEGRFRRETMPRQLGLGTATIDMPESVTITDPVAGYSYTLIPSKNLARRNAIRAYTYTLGGLALDKAKLEADQQGYAVALKRAAEGQNLSDEEKGRIKEKLDAAQQKAETAKTEKLKAEVEQKILILNGAKVAPTAITEVYTTATVEGRQKYETKTESLGVQNIDGVNADGTRTTTTIPAGSIGNERPIEIVYERWYSKDLGMVIKTIHNDPRSGEQTYSLTNLNLSEPPSTLFAPPADYRIEDVSKSAVRVTTARPAVKAIAPVAPVAPGQSVTVTAKPDEQ